MFKLILLVKNICLYFSVMSSNTCFRTMILNPLIGWSPRYWCTILFQFIFFPVSTWLTISYIVEYGSRVAHSIVLSYMKVRIISMSQPSYCYWNYLWYQLNSWFYFLPVWSNSRLPVWRVHTLLASLVRKRDPSGHNLCTIYKFLATLALGQQQPPYLVLPW